MHMTNHINSSLNEGEYIRCKTDNGYDTFKVIIDISNDRKIVLNKNRGLLQIKKKGNEWVVMNTNHINN